MTADQDLAGLPEDVREALDECQRCVECMHIADGDDAAAQTIRAGLSRLARENAELRELVADWERVSSTRDRTIRDADGRAERAETELATARETIKRLNRRVQVAEAGVAEKVSAAAPGSLGRALANAAAGKYLHERDELRHAADTFLAAVSAYHTNEWDRVNIRQYDAAKQKLASLLPVGGE